MRIDVLPTPPGPLTAPQAGGTPAEANEPQGLMRAISLRDLWAPVYRSRVAVIAIFAAVFALAVLATLLIQPVFRATSTVEIRAETQKVLGTEDRNDAASSSVDAQRFLDTQLNIIRSRSTAAAVAQSLGFYNNNRFLAAMGFDVEPNAPIGVPEAHRRTVNGVLLENLQVSFDDETRIAKIQFSSPDPKLAQDVANSFADNYIRLNLARRFDASSYSLDFLRDQLREAQQRLANSERRSIDYARQSRLIDTSNAASGTGAGGPQSLTAASLVSLNQTLSDATAKRIAAEERWRVTSGAALTAVPEVVGNPTVQVLQQQGAQLRAELQQELQTRTDDYPTVRQLRARVAALDGQIALAAGRVKNTVREEYETARAQEQALRRTIEQLKTTTLDEQNRSIQLSILRREADTNRQQLGALLTRYNELNAQSGIQLNNLSVIDRAEQPTAPFWPSVPLNIALALVASILLSAIWVIGRENLFEMVRTPDDITGRLRLPMLGAVPADPEIKQHLDDPKSSVSEAISAIRTSLSLTSPAGIPASVMLTSTQAGEGKSTLCFGLAQSLAKLGRTVVIIDADLRRPNVHRLFDVKNTAGVSNILAGNASIDEVVLRGKAPGLDVIVAGPIPPDASELLAAGALKRLVADLKGRYDHVVVDSAPLLGLADAPLVATSVDGMIYVVESARSNVRGVQNATARLRESGTPLLGVILSRFDPGKSGYAYEYQYAYQYSYGKTDGR